jgi:homeobox protein cut-like
LLREEIRAKEWQFSSEKQELVSKIEGLEREITSLNSNLTSLEAQVASAPNQALVESMKRELRILKRLEYNADDVDTELDPEIAGGSSCDEKDLESVLVAKLRKSECDLVMERNSKSDLLSTMESLKVALSASEKSKQEAEKLVAALEKDLERAISTQTTEHPNKNVSHLPVAIQENPDMLQHVLDPSIPAPSNVSTIAAPAMPTSEKAMDDHSVATIVMAQRDRLRARCEALEAERDSFKRELQGQVLAAETLKADNTKLYEKVRYLQSYNAGGMNAGAGNAAAYRRNVGLDRDLDLEALEQRYEASVDPFKQFSKAERARKLGEMSPMERTVFVIAKTVLCKFLPTRESMKCFFWSLYVLICLIPTGFFLPCTATKEMRTGLFFYMLALHLLVFVTTYHWSSSSSCDHYFDHEALSHLPPVLPSRMQHQMKAESDGSV